MKLVNAEEIMREQKYYCEKCDLNSSILYTIHEDFMTVYYRLQDDHSKKSPKCVFDGKRVAVKT